MKKLLRYSKLLQVMLVIFLITCMVLPTTIIAYAETPISVAVVASSSAEDGLGSPFQHHSFIDDGTSWVFYLSGNMILNSYSDDGTIWVAGSVITWCNATTAETPGGQFDTWWDAGTSTVHFAVVNTSANDSDILYNSYTVDSAAHTLTANAPNWVAAVEGIANVSYRNPTICYTQNASVFVTYGSVNNSVSDVYVTATNSTVNNPWVPEVGFPMNNLSANASRPTMYGSVIPLWTDAVNVSVQYAGYNGSVYKIYQTYVTWDGATWDSESPAAGIDSSDWYLPDNFEWNYNAVSIDTVINNDDVAIQCGQTDGASLYRTFFNRRGDEGDIWAATYAQNFGQGGYSVQYISAMGIRNNAYGLVWSGWDMAALSEDIWSNDYDPTTLAGTWSGVENVYDDANVPLVNTMSDYMYDIDGTYDMGFIYGTTTDDNIMYGRYGPAVPTPVGATGTTILQLILPLLIAVLTLILILKAMPEAGIRGVIMAIALAAIVGAIAFEIVKAVVDIL